MEQDTKISGSPWESVEDRRKGRATKRKAIVNTAVAFFNERGFNATTLDDIASALQVTKPTIYHYFKTKEDILSECFTIGLNYVQSGIDEMRLPGRSGFDRLQDYLYRYALSATAEFTKCVNLTEELDLSPDRRQAFRTIKKEIDHHILQTIKDGIADGSIANVNPRIAAFAVTGALNTISRWFKAEGPMSARTASSETVDFLLRSLRPDAAPKPARTAEAANTAGTTKSKPGRARTRRSS